MNSRQRLAGVVREHALDDAALPALGALVDALGDARAPTSIHRPAATIDVHIADSLSALALSGWGSAGNASDIGAGAGLPGLVLAVALPGTHFSLVESSARKCTFIRETVRAMGLTNVSVIESRAEDWREGIGTQDVVCARAVAALPVLLEYAAPLLRLGGTLIAWKGEVEEAEAADGAAAARLLGFDRATVSAVTPFSGSERRTLHRFEKVAQTPPRFPRRAGIASKRPLTASGS